MKAKKLISLAFTGAMVLGLAACGSSATTSTTSSTVSSAAEESADAESAAEEPAAEQRVGISLPAKDPQKWSRDGDNMKSGLEAAGYTVDLQYASDDAGTQLSQIENMISGGDEVLVIAAVESSSLGEALDMAKEADIPVVAYDRLLMDSDAVSYYATFDNYQVGTVQGQYIVDMLDLDNADGPFNLEITSGDPDDTSAGYFYNGAMDVLQPYIDEGKLVVPSGQTSFADTATSTGTTETAESRAENILASYYEDGPNVDAWLCADDTTALGVENALAANYSGDYPIVTGQDCDIENVRNIIAGRQAMSVFRDRRTLANRVVRMVGQILTGEEVDVNDTGNYNNNVITVPTYLCAPVYADINNYEEVLIDSGYYTEEQLQ